MGARVHVPRALTVALLAAATAGCIDFVEPELPERGAPAVVQAFVRASRDSISVQATLMPGLEEDGTRRTVLLETLLVADTAIAPLAVAVDGERSYAAEWRAAGIRAGVIAFEAPTIAEVAAAPPAFAWSGIRPLDPDTVRLAAGEELALRIAAGSLEQPAPDLRQWQLQLTGAAGAFRIGADGAPPDTVLVPARWLPEPLDGRIAARLTYIRSATVRPAPGDYVGLVLLDLRVTWTIVIIDGTTAAAGRPRDYRE